MTGVATIQCLPDRITVTLEKASMPDLDMNYLRLKDPTCSLTSNLTHIIGVMSLTTCGTKVEVCIFICLSVVVTGMVTTGSFLFQTGRWWLHHFRQQHHVLSAAQRDYSAPQDGQHWLLLQVSQTPERFQWLQHARLGLHLHRDQLWHIWLQL